MTILTSLNPRQALIVVLLGFLLLTESIAAPVTIYPVGDSITRGRFHQFDANEYPRSAYRLEDASIPNTLHSYREHLHDLLISPACDAQVSWKGGKFDAGRTPSAHEGRSGWRVDQYLKKEWAADTDNSQTMRNFEGWLGIYNPDLIILEVGTNDMLRGSGATETADELDQLISNIYNTTPSVTIVLTNLLPITGFYAEHLVLPPYDFSPVGLEAQALNGLISNLVSTRQSNGDDIHLVDINSDFYINEADIADCDGDHMGDPFNMTATACTVELEGRPVQPDGVHPNLLGEKFIADQIFNVMSDLPGVCDTGSEPTPGPEIITENTWTNTGNINTHNIGGAGELSNANDLWLSLLQSLTLDPIER